MDAVEITIADTLSPIEMDTTKLQDFFKLNALGSDDDALPTLVIGDTPCVETDTTTTVCTVTAEHSQTLVPYRFNLNPKAAADAAGNPSPLLESPAYHCPENVPVGANGKCIKFDLAVNENKRSRSGADFTNPADMTEYIVGESYRISPWELVEDATIVSDGDFDDITYTLADALDGWFVGTGTGEITGVFKEPSKEGGPVKMTLYAVDATGQRAKVEEYTFKVVSPPKFVLKSSNARRKTGDAFTNPKDIEANSNTFYAVGDTYKISPRTVLNTTEFSSVGGSLDTLVYGLAGTLPEDLFVKTTTGDILVTFTAADEGKTYSVNLDVIDGTERATLETMTMEVKYRDVKDPNNRAAFGPNKKVCEHGALVDEPATQFDKRYACDCRGLQFEGDNCEIPIKELLNCKPGFALVDGKCEEFKLHVNDTKRVVQQQEGSATVYTDPTSMADTFYEVYKSYRVAAFEILSSTQPTAGNLSDITYTLGAGTPDNFFLSTTSGEIFWQFGEGDADKSFSITLNAVDKGGAVQPVETMVMNVRYNDVDVATYGPNNQTCSANTKEIIDLVPFDKQFTCECHNGFGGENCDVEVCPPGKVCDAGLNICRFDKGEVVVDPGVDGKCEPCLFNSHPNNDQTECVVDECSTLESDGLCTCDLVDLTKPVTGRVKLTCDGLKWSTATSSESATFVLPPIVHELTLNAVEAEQLPTMLQGMSGRSDGGGIPADVDAVANSTNITTSSMGTSQILSVIVDQAAFAAGIAATEQDDPEAVGGAQASMASENVGVGNESAVAVASRSIAQMQECGMDGIVPATDFAIPIGICSEKNDDAADCATVCPVGEFADLSNVENSGACTPCERGGFFADTEGRVGRGSHCACTMCKDGTWSAEVGADDPNEDCQVCPSGTQSDTPAGYRACPCLANFSRTDRFGECSTCEGVLGIKCEADARVLQQGFFWEFPSEEKEVEYLHFTANLGRSSDYDRALATFNGTYPPAYACPTPGNCLGVTENAASTCKDGTTGPLCAVCEETHFRLNGVCSACPQSKAGSVVSLIVIVLLFAIAIALVLRQNAKDIPLVDDWNPEKNESSEEAPSQVSASIAVLGQQAPEAAHKVEFMTLVKIVLGYTQIKALIQEVYPGIQWPTSYRSFTGGLQFMSSNPLSIVMPSCLSPSLTITSYGEFVIAALTPLVIAPIIWIYYKIKARNLPTVSTASVPQAIKDGKRDPYTLEDLQALCISTACFVYYLLYPTIAVSSVRLLAACDSICRTGDGTDCITYLRADYSIQCDGQDSRRHNGFKVAAGFAFVVYSIVLPAGIAFLLRRGRQGGAKDLASALMAGFSFYSKQYKPGYYFWETVDLYRKLFLTSMVVFIEDGTSMQVTFGIIFAVVGMSLQMIYNPYKHRDENRLALASQVITLLALLVGSLMRATQAEKGALMKSGNIDSVVTGAYLVTSGVLLYCLALVSFILYRYYKNNQADADTAGNGLETTSSEKLGSLELTMFSAAEAAQSSEVLYTEVDVGASKRNISNSASHSQEKDGSSKGAGLNSSFEVDQDADVDLKPTAVEETHFDGVRSVGNNHASANKADYLDVGEAAEAGNSSAHQGVPPRTAAGEAGEQFNGFGGGDSGAPHATPPVSVPTTKELQASSKAAHSKSNTAATVNEAGFPDGFEVGKRCSVTGHDCNGVIRFLGPHAESGKLRVGVELDKPVGKHNGSPKGTDHTYFTCPKKHGIMVPHGKVQLLLEGAGEEIFGGFDDAAHN